jgi:hypothetical protein
MAAVVKSVAHHENGLSGQPYYAAIVSDPFGVGAMNAEAGADFLIILYPTDEHTVAIPVDKIAAHDLQNANTWPGGTAGMMLRHLIMAAAEELKG